MRFIKVKNQIRIAQSNQCLTLFYKEIAKYDLLSAEEEAELFFKLKTGDKLVAKKIIESNLKFVVCVAKQLSKRSDNLMDLINQGNIGLILAMNKFDPTKGVKFITFAVHYIQREIMNYLSNVEKSVRISNNNKTFYTQSKLESNFLHKEGRLPTEEEMIELIKNEYGYVIKNTQDLYKVEFLSIDKSQEQAENNSSDFLLNSYSSYNSFEKEVDNDNNKFIVNTLMSNLSKRDQKIIEYLYGIGKEREYEIMEVASIFNMTTERIRQIKCHSIELMKEIYKNKTKKERC